jgi:U4/U6 small nuclear ribonucleoprotein PRP3
MENRKRHGNELTGSDKKKARSELTEQSYSDLAAKKEALKKSLEKHALMKKERNGFRSNGNENKSNGLSTGENSDRSKVGVDLLAEIRQRKAALSKLVDSVTGSTRGGEPAASDSSKAESTNNQMPRALGLNAPVHPLLFEKDTGLKSVPDNSKNVVAEKFNPYLDFSPENTSNSIKRRTRGLVFNQKGKYIRQADELRRQIKLDELKKRFEEKKKETYSLGIDFLAGEREYKRADPPLIEWWDEKLVMKEDRYSELDDVDIELNPKLSSQDSEITEYILHPIPIPPPWEKHLPKQPTKLHLTKREVKQIRKRERSEKHKEKQDRIRLGLDPAPPPKVKPSNVMSIYTDEAIRDPTAMEMKARQEVDARKEKHENDNEARKLTPEQRWDKEQARIDAQKEKGLYCAVFRVENLSDGKHRFLVNLNAIEYKFTGITIFNDKFNLIIVEGGFLQIKKYKHLLLDRVKWKESAPQKKYSDDGEEAPPVVQDLSHNRCQLIWNGQLKNLHFSRWSQFHAETEQDAKDALARHGVDHFWIEARSLSA